MGEEGGRSGSGRVFEIMELFDKIVLAKVPEFCKVELELDQSKTRTNVWRNHGNMWSGADYFVPEYKSHGMCWIVGCEM